MADNQQEQSNIRHLNGSQRLFERYSGQRFSALVNRRPAKVVNWSQGGIGIITAKNSFELGQVVDIVIQFTTDEGEQKSCHAKASVVHLNDNGYTGLQFNNVSPATAGILHYLAVCYRDQRPIESNALNAAANAAVLQRNKDLDYSPKASFVKNFMALSLVMAMMFIVGTVLYTWLFKLEAPYAAITAPSITLTAPDDGRVMLYDEQASIEVEQPLLKIENVSLIAEYQALNVQRDFLNERLAIMETQLKSANRTAYFQRKAARSASRQKMAEVQMAKSTLNEKQREYNRLKALHAKGHVSNKRLQDASDAKDSANASLRAVQATLSEAQDFENLTQTRNNKETPDEVMRDISYTNAEIGYLEKRAQLLKQQLDKLLVKSPCDCLPVKFFVATNTWVKKGDPVILLQYPDTTIEARVDWQQMSQLSVDTEAKIKLTDGTYLNGYIKSVESTSNQQYLGLPPEIAENPRFARVLISLHNKDEKVFRNKNLKAGQTVNISFKTPDKLLNRLGIFR